MASDSLRLLGTFQLIHHGQLVPLGQPRLEELLALLALRPGVPVARARIAYHFWPESSERQARTNARNLLFKLKQLWPQVEEVLEIGRTELTWRAETDVALDTQQFQAALDAADEATQTAARVPLLANAVAYYGGELLPSSYAEWVLSEREQLRLRFVAALEALIEGLLELRHYEEALHRATALRDHDPLHEASYRLIMQIHTLLGNRAAALRVYHDCVSVLEKELGVAPSAATAQLHTQLVHRAPSHPQRSATATIQRPRLVGRHREWQQLQQAWRTVQSGNAHAVIVWGEAGIGKTRLAEELLDWVQRLGDVAVSSRSYAVRGALSYAPITEWLRSSTIQAAVAAVDDLWRVELARLLPELLTERPDLPAPGPLTEPWQQQRFYQSIAHALAAVTGPLLLHLDDMQWSDQETVALLQFLLHGSRNSPLLILGTVRSEDAVENQPLHDLAAALRHQNQLTELTLAPLSETEVIELAEQTAGDAIPVDTARALYIASEGHPLFLIETVRGDLTALPAQGNGVGNRAAPVQEEGLPAIPPKIYTLFATRLGQLSRAAQQVANTAAVIGRAFTYPVLQAATTLDEPVLVDALDELWSRRLIREQGGDRYDFSHDRIREVAYQEISRARRRLLHRRVAQALEAIHGDDLDEVAGELAAHFAAAGDSERAYRYYRQAAKMALEQFALVYAEALFDRALAYAPDDPTLRILLLQEQNAVFQYTLHLDRWSANLEQQQALLNRFATPDPDWQMEIELGYGEFERAATRPAKAAAHARAAISIAEKLDKKDALARCYLELGAAQWMETHLAEASVTFGQAARYANRTGEHSLEARSLTFQAQTGMFTGMSAQQIEALLRQALVMAKETDDKLEMANLYHKLSYLPVAQGMGGFPRAEQHALRALALAQVIGHRIQEENTLSNLGILYTHQGDHRKAIAVHEQSLQLIEGLSDHWRRWSAIGYWGGSLVQIGDLASARTLLVTAGEGLKTLGVRHFEVKVRSELGLLYHLDGDDHSAQEELRYLLYLLEEHRDLRYVALVCTRLGYVLESSGQLDAACQQYEQGRQLHDQMGQHYYAMNALAGLARVAARRGDDATALAHAQTIWQTIGGQETDATVETARTLRTCYDIFRQHGDPQAADVLETASAQLRRRAATIDDPEHLTLFWHLGDHRFFQELAFRVNST